MIFSIAQVSALPSVFAFRRGRLVDAFVGMPPQGLMQQFMMRLLMGTPRPAVDPNDQHAKTDDELAALGNKLAHFAGTWDRGQERCGLRWLAQIDL